MIKRTLAVSLLLASAALSAQQPEVGIAPVTLGSEPYVFDTAEQHKIKVSVLTKGLARPFAIEFLPGGDLLIAERGEIPFTGGLERVVLGADMGDVRRETLLTELHQRVRDFAEGPDGLIYVLTDGNENAVLRIEPAAP